MANPPKKKQDSRLNSPPPEGGHTPTPEQEAIIKAKHEWARRKQQQSYEKDGMEIRTYVLHVALSMEAMISNLLGELLNIEVPTSHVIGYRSNPISFNQKVWFLIEIEAIRGEDYKDFQRFMEIRNMLMHNLEARTLEDCFRMISDKEGSNSTTNKVIGLADAEIPKMYKTRDVWTVEKRLDLGVRILVDQVAKKAEEAITVLSKRTMDRVELLACKAHRDRFVHEINLPGFEEAQRVMKSLKLTYGRKEVVQILERASKNVHDRYKNAFREELLKQVNVVREKAKMDPLDSLPDPPAVGSPSDYPPLF